MFESVAGVVSGAVVRARGLPGAIGDGPAGVACAFAGEVAGAVGGALGSARADGLVAVGVCPFLEARACG